MSLHDQEPGQHHFGLWSRGHVHAHLDRPHVVHGALGCRVVKAAAHWLTTGVPLAIAAPVLGVLLHLDPSAFGLVVVTLLLGTPALSVIGTFGSALTVGIRRGGLLLSLIVLPLYLPTLIFGAEAVRRGVDGQDPATPLLMLGGITAGAVALLPFATAAVLRMNLR